MQLRCMMPGMRCCIGSCHHRMPMLYPSTATAGPGLVATGVTVTTGDGEGLGLGLGGAGTGTVTFVTTGTTAGTCDWQQNSAFF